MIFMGIIIATLLIALVLLYAAYRVVNEERNIFIDRIDVNNATIKDLQVQIIEIRRTRPIKCPQCHRYAKRNTLTRVNGKMVCRKCAKKAANK